MPVLEGNNNTAATDDLDDVLEKLVTKLAYEGCRVPARYQCGRVAVTAEPPLNKHGRSSSTMARCWFLRC
jgi:hypothetical protein